MVLLSKERLQERLRQSRERQEKKRQAEKERRRAIKQEVLSELKKPKKIKIIKLDDNDSSKEKIHYTVDTESSLISNILIGDIYETREELIEAEKRGEGKINWDYFDASVKRVRDMLK